MLLLFQGLFLDRRVHASPDHKIFNNFIFKNKDYIYQKRTDKANCPQRLAPGTEPARVQYRNVVIILKI